MRFGVIDSLDVTSDMILKCVRDKEISWTLCDTLLEKLATIRRDIMLTINHDMMESRSTTTASPPNPNQSGPQVN